MATTDRLRRVMAVLGPVGLAKGSYCEDPSGMEWLQEEATDVCRAVDEGRDLASLLEDTGFWSPDDGPFPADLTERLRAAVGS